MNIKKILSIIIVFCLATSVMSNTTFAETLTSIWLEAESVTVEKGTTDVSVGIKLTNNVGIATIGFNVEYNSKAMTLKSVDCGKVFNASEMTIGDLSSNPYMVSMLRSTDNTAENGNIVTLNFRLSSDCDAGTYPIILSDGGILGGAFNINEEEVNMRLTNGNIVVRGTQENSDKYIVSFNSNGGSEVASQTVVSGNMVSKPNNPIKNGYTFDGWYVDSAFAKPYDFSNVVTTNITLYAKWKEREDLTLIYGDVDNNKILTATDAVNVLQKVLNMDFKLPIEETNTDYMKFADVDNDGFLTSSDAAMILQKVMNKDFVFPVER